MALELSRRKLITSAATFVACAPAIVRVSSLMVLPKMPIEDLLFENVRRAWTPYLESLIPGTFPPQYGADPLKLYLRQLSGGF